MKPFVLRTIFIFAFVSGIFTSGRSQSVLVAHFGFDSTLTDELGNATAVSYQNLTGSVNSGEFKWLAIDSLNGGGLVVSLPDSVFSEEHYSIAIEFAYNEVTGYRKIIDFSNEGEDYGFYVNDNLRLYSSGNYGPTVLEDTTFYTVLITRDSTLDSSWSYICTENSYTLESVSEDGSQYFVAELLGNDRVLGFFHDDTTTVDEFASGGIVRDIRIWNGLVNPASVIVGMELPAVQDAPQIYPNPAKGSVQVAFSSPQSGTLEIYNVLGGKEMEAVLINVSQAVLNIEGLPGGIYFVRINGTSSRFIKQ